MVKEIDNYESAVRYLASQNSDQWISNSKPEHAAVLYKTFFGIATKKIDIFCRNLNGGVFEVAGVLTAALAAIERGVQFRIIVQQQPDPGNKFYEAMRAKNDGQNVSVSVLSMGHMYAELKDNFCVVDGKALRYEADAENCEAVASMNRPVEAMTFSRYFEKIVSELATGQPSEGLFVRAGV